jgi:hypothetical protein
MPDPKALMEHLGAMLQGIRALPERAAETAGRIAVDPGVIKALVESNFMNQRGPGSDGAGGLWGSLIESMIPRDQSDLMLAMLPGAKTVRAMPDLDSIANRLTREVVEHLRTGVTPSGSNIESFIHDKAPRAVLNRKTGKVTQAENWDELDQQLVRRNLGLPDDYAFDSDSVVADQITPDMVERDFRHGVVVDGQFVPAKVLDKMWRSLGPILDELRAKFYDGER